VLCCKYQVSQSKSDTKGPKDYKAIFGPDYKKGDIGHSKGVVIEKPGKSCL